MAAEELRYLLASGYPGDSALRFVSDHRRLPQEKRFILARAVAADEVALCRRSKRAALQEISGKILFVDGYNVLITVEGLILGCPVYLCDDGFCRDTRGLFSGYRPSKHTEAALAGILDMLVAAHPADVQFLLDRPMSRSGELAGRIRRMMGERALPGGAEAAVGVDRQLKIRGAAGSDVYVASSDCHVIDCAARVVDIAGEMAQLLGIALRRI
ncbi:MAG TPA: DUF434 domain-containing protein [Methanothrix sp.]|nr:DUF434 domain-containing protein [Methanothrix sp.]HPC88730.1 DUF434 domain-containing protein [Methanothrix sp.]HQE86796.1 DUF434 domain-containing protein [Methanothrix sp.]HQI68077.1 DUF434 domain-containing protein [Methanothrix sp.]HRS84338.1 DUF434 domain-containing protein [Methanothrix sp.]